MKSNECPPPSHRNIHPHEKLCLGVLSPILKPQFQNQKVSKASAQERESGREILSCNKPKKHPPPLQTMPRPQMRGSTMFVPYSHIYSYSCSCIYSYRRRRHHLFARRRFCWRPRCGDSVLLCNCCRSTRALRFPSPHRRRRLVEAALPA